LSFLIELIPEMLLLIWEMRENLDFSLCCLLVNWTEMMLMTKCLILWHFSWVAEISWRVPEIQMVVESLSKSKFGCPVIYLPSIGVSLHRRVTQIFKRVTVNPKNSCGLLRGTIYYIKSTTARRICSYLFKDI
jgi:hypothetical protein